MEGFREASIPKSRDGKLQENGLQAHLRVVHGYAMTRLAARHIIQLVLMHQTPRHSDHPDVQP